MRRFATALLLMLLAGPASGQEQFDLLLKGGHVVDPKNGISEARDVAISRGKVVAVAPEIDAGKAHKTIDVSGYVVTPGLIDIHAHVYAGTGERSSYAGDLGVYPDSIALRSGVTAVADAGCSGWRNFEDFKQRVIDRSRTRVFAFLNIVGSGMRGQRFEQDTDDMAAGPAAEMARKYPGIIVGIKTAHYMGRDFFAVDRAIEAGSSAGIPIMVDFGRAYPEKSLEALLTEKLRPGDIYTHVYSGLRGELAANGHANPALLAGRERGVLFDVGHGSASFTWRVAVPIIEEGFLPDTISTDIHVSSAGGGMKDMLNVMSKFVAMGVSLEDVILRSTWNAAKTIHHEELGHLSVGAPADVAVLRVEEGKFGYLDGYGGRLRGDKRLSCEMTLRDGKVVYELNGLARPDWTALPKDYRRTGDARWDGIRSSSGRMRLPTDDTPPPGADGPERLKAEP